MRNREGGTAQPLVSVIVPFFNEECLVDECLSMLVGQDCVGRYEIVCVDDGSTDRTPQLLDSWAATHPGLVVVEHGDNAGLSEARNRGVRRTRGELITFVDADDIVSPHYIRTLMGAHDGSYNTLVQARFVVDTNRSRLRTLLVADKSSGSYVFEGDEVKRAYLLGKVRSSPWACLAHRSLYEQVPFPRGRLYEDVWLSVDVAGWVNRVVSLDACVYGYYRHVGTLSRPMVMARRDVEDLAVAVRHVEQVTRDWPSDMGPFVTRKMANLHLLLLRKASELPDSGASRPYYMMCQKYLCSNLPALIGLWREGLWPARRMARYALAAIAPELYASLHRKRHASKLRRIARTSLVSS